MVIRGVYTERQIKNKGDNTNENLRSDDQAGKKRGTFSTPWR